MNPHSYEQSWLSRFLVLGTLTGFGVAQPLYELLGRAPEFLLLHEVRPAELLLLCAALSVALPLLLTMCEQLLEAVRDSLGRRAHLANAALLSGAFWLQLSKRWLDDHAIASYTVAIALTALFVAAYRYWAGTTTLLKLLSPTILLFPTLFLARGEVRELLRPPTYDRLARTEIDAPTPVVLVVFDALPLFSLLDERGAIDPIRYPAFADLAATSTWFTRATTVSDHTTKAIPAILSGRRPRDRGLPTYQTYPANLFTLLGGSYRMRVAERSTKLCPNDLCGRREKTRRERLSTLASDLSIVYLHLLLPAEPRSRLPSVATDWTDFRPAELLRGEGPGKGLDRVSVFEGLIESVEPEPLRTLYFIHSFLPHPPHRLLPSGRRFTRYQREPSGLIPPWQEWPNDELAVLHSQQRHLLQLQLADRLLGELLTRLREQGVFDRAIVVVTADHGASFRPGVAHRELTEENAADILAIPLLLKRPHQTLPEVDDRLVETIDILPTILQLLGIDLGEQLDGHSLLDESWSGRPLRTVSRPRASEPVEVAALDIDPSLRRMLETFGSGETGGRFPRVEAYPNLVGQDPAPFVGAPRGYGVDVTDQRYLARVRRFSGFVPAQIAGILSLPTEQALPICLAVALNGPIESTTCVYQRSEDPLNWRWSVLVPENRLRGGRNLVEVFVIEDTDTGITLIPTTPDTGQGAPRQRGAR